MSKRMGLTLLSSFLPTTTHAAQQLMKMGGGGTGGVGSLLTGVRKAWGGMKGLKNYWGGQQLGMKGGVLGWEAGDKASRLALRSTRRAGAGYLGAMGAMNLMVGDNGFIGSAKWGINTGSALAGGGMALPGIWRLADARKTALGRRGIKGATGGAIGLWAASKMGVI